MDAAECGTQRRSQSPHFILRGMYFTGLGEDDFYKKVGVYAASDLLIEMLHYIQDWKGAISVNDDKKYTFLKTILLTLPDASDRRLPFTLPVAKDPRLYEAITFLQDNLMENIDISTLSTRFGFSLRSLQRLFQEDLKMSYAQYLKTLRIIKALELLNSTDITLSEIAIQVGYNSFPTFSNTFLEIVGVRPKVYKR
jgi:AraC-like DNA-binding protein